MKILFVCMANRVRSRGAEAWCKQKFPEHEFKSCGTSTTGVERAQWAGFKDAKVVTQEMVDWADKIVFMERKNMWDTRKVLGFNCIENKQIEVWGLPDNWDNWDDPDFIAVLESMEFDDFFK